MQNVAQIGAQKLLFGTYATRKFCWLRGITNDVPHIIDALVGEDKMNAAVDMVRAGVESQYASEKKVFDLTEFEVDSLVDQLTTEGKAAAEKIMHAFIGSVVGKPANEVPALLEQIAKEAEEAAKKAEKAEKAASEPGKPKTQTKSTDTSTGDSSKN